MTITKRLATLWIFILGAILLADSALAQSRQSDPDLGGILEDILGGKPYPGAPAPFSGHIENIPVLVKFDQGQDRLPDDAMIVVTAYAPPRANERRAAPLMLGESKILLRGLNAPLRLVIAVPASETHDIDYANINAKIIDGTGTPLFGAPEYVQYRGVDQAVIRLRDQRTTTRPYPDENLVKFETVKGQVSLPMETMLMRGSNLVVRLVEDSELAGGTSQLIAGEAHMVLDGKSSPYTFKFTRPINSKTANAPLVFDAWIEDWAGRKTLILPKPVRFNGGGRYYDLALVHTVNADPPTNPEPRPLPAISNRIKGEARFDAYKGLPPGSVMIVELERQDYSARPARLATRRIPLDGLSGYVPFDFTTEEPDIYTQNPKPRIRIRIEDKTGRIYFSNPGGQELKQGFNPVQLRAAPNY